MLKNFLISGFKPCLRRGILKTRLQNEKIVFGRIGGFLDPVLAYLETHRELPSFKWMLENRNNWAENLIQFAKRHRTRGIGVDMFHGCFKTLIHSIEQMIVEMSASAEEKIESLAMIRRWSDGAEILMLADWKMMGQLEAVERLAETNRELTLGKNKYENILEATSDMVFGYRSERSDYRNQYGSESCIERT